MGFDATRRTLPLPLALLFVPLALSCGDDDPTGPAAPAATPQVASVTVAPTPVSLTSLGSTAQLSASATDERGRPIAARFVWQSSDQTVAVVDTAGIVRAKAAGSAIVSAVAGGVAGHATVTVTQTATALAFVTQPADATAGAPISPAIRVEIRDAQGARVRGATDAITLVSADSSAVLGTATVNAADGVATFSGLALERAGAARTLRAVASELTAATSAPFDVAPAAAAALAFETESADAGAGDTIRVQVGLRDAFGNVVAAGADSITLRLADDAAQLGGTTTRAAVDGVATFDVVVERASDAHRLRASAVGFGAATSAPFAIAPGVGAALTFLTEPGDVRVGEPFADSIRVALVDAYGNITDADSLGVRITFGAFGTGLQGNDIAYIQEGVASFHPWTLGYDDDYTLVANATGLDSVVSRPFDVRLEFASLAVGDDHACALTGSGIAYCWGQNVEGELGDGTDDDRSVPTPVVTALRFDTIATGYRFTCALARPDGDAWCWGANNFGKLGADTIDGEYPLPIPVAGGRNYTSIALGANHACALEASGQAWCWGDNGDAELGDGTTVDRSAPVAVLGHVFTTLTAGTKHTCGIAAGGAYCWGDNPDGQLGDNSTEQRAAPAAVNVFTTARHITAGNHHTCGVTGLSPRIWCWGDNGNGQLGLGFTSYGDSVPRLTDSDLAPRQLEAGWDHTCAITTADTVYCWGRGQDGRLGDGSAETRLRPVAVVGLPPVASVSAGDSHTCALTTAGAVYCWGRGTSSQLGDGRVQTSYVPVRVPD